MSQSVKLGDGSYFDTVGVYDTIQGNTQQAINSNVASAISDFTSSVSSLSTTTARLGTWLAVGLNSVNKWTTSSSNTLYDAASLTLPAGTWLVVGHFMDWTGYLRMWINNVSGICEHAAHDSACSAWTMDCFAITTGNRTVTLRLCSQKANVTHNWSQDGNYWRLYAICIG